MAERFTLYLIKPSHYDDDGYVIQWFRAAIPSNTLAVLNGLALDCRARRVLGEDVDIDIVAIDETNTRVRPERIAEAIAAAGGRGLVCLVGVQSNQFPRAVDLTRRFRAAGAQVAIGGFHVSGCLTMLPEMPDDLKEAQALGASLYAGEAEGRFETVLVDAYEGRLRPLYNFIDDLPGIAGAPLPLLPAESVVRTAGTVTTLDAGRGCPFQCSFCTIINVQGRKSRVRTPDDVEAIIRANLAQGVHSFFITDDNLARNKAWEPIFDRLIALRRDEGLRFTFVIQVDTLCHRVPRFIEKAAAAGVRRVFLGLENINPESLVGAKKKQNRIAEYRMMLLAWKAVGCVTYAGYILGFPADTPETIVRDIKIIQRELPLDLLEFFCLTPLPGSEDHQKLAARGAPMDPDMNRYDLEHVVTDHPRMSKQEWEDVYRLAWRTYYTPEHMATVMRRAAATGISVGRMMFLLLWFYGCVTVEKLHPLQGGYLRRKVRSDRRPDLPIQHPLVFYPKFALDLVAKHVVLLWLIWRSGAVRRAIKRDPLARAYRDQALTPVTAAELDDLELFTVTASARAAAEKIKLRLTPA
jgi:radical SAM superfamily enzyme YgiQ (UPF0313 family)